MLPSPADLRWLDGEPARRPELEAAIARLARGEGVAWLRRRERRRRPARVALADGGGVFAKHFLSGGRHPWREWWKRRLRLTTAEREWRTLVRLREAGVPVPAPLAHVLLGSGEHVLVTEWVAGTPLHDALDGAPRARRQTLAAVGELVRRLHAAGWVHRDLHGENVLVADGVPTLIDLQAALRVPGAGARQRDLGALDHSLRRALSLPDRVRLRAAALGLARPFDRQARARLRAVGHAAQARARAHARSRARRSLRAGRRARRFAAAGGAGLLARDADEAAVREALAGASPPGVEVRRYPGRPRLPWQHTPARRAWALAHALEASDVVRVRPLAFLEWSRFGRAGRSALVVEAPAPEPLCPPAVARAAHARLRQRLRDAGLAIGALAPGGVGLAERNGAVEAQVVALEAIRFAARCRAAPGVTSRGSSPSGSSSTSR